MDDIDWKAWALAMCSLLDAIEDAIYKGDRDTALALVGGRHKLAQDHGLKVQILGKAGGAGETH